jgi:hypothetical protein
MYQETIFAEFIPVSEYSEVRTKKVSKSKALAYLAPFADEESYFLFRFYESLWFPRELVEYVNQNISFPEESYRKLFWYLVDRLDSRLPRILVGEKLVASFTGKRVNSHKVQVRSFLIGFRDFMLKLGGKFRFKPHQKDKGISTHLRKGSYSFGRHHERILQLLNQYSDQIYPCTGKPATNHSIRRDQERIELHESGRVRKLEPVAEVEKFRIYLNRQPMNATSKRIGKYFNEAIEKTVEIYRDTEQCEQAKRLLQQLRRTKKNNYQYSATGRSVRLYQRGVSQGNINRNIRKILMPTQPECDIKCAQLAIGSVIFDFPKIYEFLSDVRNNHDIWKEILSDISPQDSMFYFIKSCAKTAIYAAMYLMERIRIYFMLVDELKKYLCINEAKSRADEILDSWVFQEVFDRTNRFAQRLYNGEYVTDAFGREFRIENGVSAESLMACIAQSYEFKILYPAFQYLIDQEKEPAKKTQVRVELYQFDGFSLWCKDINRVEYYKREINKRVEEGLKEIRVNERNIPTTIEWKQ